MYQAINDYVIVKEEKTVPKTLSGIIVQGNEQKTYTVVATTSQTKELQGKQVVFTSSHQLEDGYSAVDYHNIVAISVV